MLLHCKAFSGIALCQGLLCLIPGRKGNDVIISEKVPFAPAQSF